MKTITCTYCNKVIPIESECCMYCGERKVKKEPLKIEKILNQIQNQKFTKKILLSLTDEFNKSWNIIKERQLLTHFFIDVIREARLPSHPTYLAHRTSGDSRTGGIFEDSFGQMISSYLQSDPSFWTEEREFQLTITINDPIVIPYEPRKRKVDVIIRWKKTGAPLMILELKASYSRRSIKKYYFKTREMFQRLSPNLEYFLIIFCANKLKSQTYKRTVHNCRVICYDFKVDQETLEKQIQPKIIDPVEEIFEELKETIKGQMGNVKGNYL